MKLNSVLKPPESVAASLATAALVYGSYMHNLPSTTEIHGAAPHSPSVDSSRKKAMWTASAIVGGFFLLTRDVNVFIAGGITIVALDWQVRHANSVDHRTGKVVPYQNIQAAALASGYSSDQPMADDYAG